MVPFFYNIRNKLTKATALFIFFVIYFIVFWFMFFTKGIFINEHFYKKSANLNTITYSAFDFGCDFEQIVMKKQIDKTVITVDDKYTVTVTNQNEVIPSQNTDIELNWSEIASQKGETVRKLGQRPWPLAIIVAIIFFFAKKYNTQIYSFIYKNHAAGENYYKYFDILFSILCVAVLIYLVLPL